MFNPWKHPMTVVGRFVLAATSGTSAQRVDGWYEAGGTYLEDARLKDFFGETLSGNKVRFDPGFRFGIALGCPLTSFLGFEVESGVHYNAINSIREATASSGNIYQVPVLANLVLQLPNRTRLVPVIGAGAGAFWSYLDAQNLSLGSTTISGHAQTWVFGYQGYGGLRYQFRENMGVGVFYHYLVADGPSWRSDLAAGNLKLDALRNHSVSLTLNFSF